MSNWNSMEGFRELISGEGDNMQCPYCLSMVVDLVNECPHCEAHLPVDHEIEAEAAEYFDSLDEDYDDYDMGDEPLVDDDIPDMMDGDFDSAMASAGYGTDEDYGDYGQYDDYFDQYE